MSKFKIMQKIEKWRIEELAIVLNELTTLLRTGESRDWANVFSHFYDESQKIIFKKEFDLDALSKLVINIKNCFFNGHSFKEIALRHKSPREEIKLNEGFLFVRARLYKILTDLEHRVAEYIN